MDRPRNILFITTDQQRRDSLPCYGLDFMQTPALDRLAHEGMVFEACTSVSPVCQPARASFLLGQYPYVHGVADNFYWIRPDAPTIARQFNEAGWDSAAIGKMHFYPWDNPEGFQYRVSAEDKRQIYLNDDWTQFLEAKGLKRGHPAEQAGYSNNLGAIISPLPEDCHIDSFIGDAAVDWIKTKSPQPFFAWVSLNSPHDPYDPPAELAGLYHEAPIPVAIGSAVELNDKPAYQRQNINFYANNPLFLTDYSHLAPHQIRKMREHYLATVTLIDRQIAKIVEALEERGWLDSTLIVFSSDHGDLLGDHGLPFKSTFYENSLRVPLIVRGPGVKAGSRCSAFVDWVDLHATFLAQAGLPIPDHVQGHDLTQLFNEPTAIVKSEAYSEFAGNVMVRTADYKLVLCGDGDGELYDLNEQPLEVENHFRDPSYREIRDQLTRKVVQHLLGHSKTQSFGGGRHPIDPGRDAKFKEIMSNARDGRYPGLNREAK